MGGKEGKDWKTTLGRGRGVHLSGWDGGSISRGMGDVEGNGLKDAYMH